MRTNRIGRNLAIGSIMLMAVLLGAQTSVRGQETGSAKIARLLSESDVKFTKLANDAWTIPFEGKSMKNIPVVTSVGEGVVVTFALIPESKGVKFPAPALQKLLGFNESMDRVKIGIDKDGYVFVRIDMMLRTVDKEELTAAIDQVAAAVDEVYGDIRSHFPKK